MSDESEPVCAGLTCIRHEFALRQRVDALTAKLAEAGDVINSARAAYEDDLRKRDELAGDRARRMDAELESAYAARDDARSDRGVWKGRALVAEAAASRADARRVREAECESSSRTGRAMEAELEATYVARNDARKERDAWRERAEKAEAEHGTARADGHESGADILVSCVHDLLWSADHRGESVVDMAARCKRERDAWKERAEKAEAERDALADDDDDAAASTSLVLRSDLDAMEAARNAAYGDLSATTRERDSWRKRAENAECHARSITQSITAHVGAKGPQLVSFATQAEALRDELASAPADHYDTESGVQFLIACIHDLLWSKEHRGESVYHMAARCKRERDEAKARADAAEAEVALVEAERGDAEAERDACRERAEKAEAERESSPRFGRAMEAELEATYVARNDARKDRNTWKERAEAAEAAITWTKLERDDAADRERLAITEWHRVRDELDALAPRVRDGWDAEHTALRRELEHVRKDRDALRARLTATFKALTGEP